MKRNYKAVLSIATAVTVFGACPTAQAADIVRTGDTSTMHLWQGRAGGMVGSDHISNLRIPTGGEEVTIAYDKEVAQRTNMPRDDMEVRQLAVTFDKEVAERTNMRRAVEETQTAQAAAQE